MSIKVMSRVWDHSEQEGSRLLVLLAMADWADDDGYCWPKIAVLAHKARVDERTVQRCLADLVEAKELERSGGGGRGRSSTYRVVTGLKGDRLSPFAGNAVRDEAQARKGDAAVTVTGRPKGDKSATVSASKRVTPRDLKGDKSGSHIENHQDTSEGTALTPADAGDAQARVAAQVPATKPPAAEPSATTPQRALFAAVCAAGGWSPKDLTRGSREQLGQLVATLLTTPEAERPDADQLRATYQAELAALSARLGRRAQALTPVQFREVVGRWIAANRQEAADRQRLAEKALREAEDAARRRQERAAAEAAGPGLAHEGHEAWGRIARELRSRMSPATWASWLADAQPLALQDGVLTVQVASSYAVDWITQRLAAPLASLTEELGLEDLRFVPQELAREVRAA